MRKAKDKALKFLMSLCAAVTCLLLIGLIGYLLYRGIPGINAKFLTTQTSYISDSIGILPNILNTLYLIVLVMIIVVPLGVGAAVYLTEYASNKRISNAIGFAVETLTGIPSIIFGLVGMLFFTQILGLRQGILAGSLTLIIMVLPTVISNTKESLLAVPQSYREGALALGSGKWHMVRTVVLPNAVDGIVTGCILAVGRVVGESAALLFTAGFGLKLFGFAEALQSSAASLTVALYIYASEEGKFDVAFSIAVILICITLIINLAASLVGKKVRKS
ncbi:MAG: phosphate ABC transporter permease PstA [Oscillospiraceae bacterium]